MTTAERTPARSASMPAGLRLPGAIVEIDGDLPDGVRAALTDLTDERLHVDPAAQTIGFRVDRTDGRWSLVPEVGLGQDPGVSDLGMVSVGSSEQPATDADVLDAVVGRLNRLAFEADPRRLHLHAAAVEIDDVGVLLAGRSGSGKSTTTVELLAQGARYLSDECLTLLPGSSTVFAYPKPLTLKPGSSERFTHESAHPAAGLVAAHNGRAHLPAGKLASTTPYGRVGVVVVLRYAANEPPSFTPISAADACVRLLADSLDGVRLGPSALEVVAQVVAGASAWELVYRDARVAAELIGDIRPPWRQRLAVPHRLAIARGTDSPGCPGTNTRRSADRSVRVVRFDDSAALHDGGSRRLAVLDDEQISEIEQGARGGPGLARLSAVIEGELSLPDGVPDPWAPLAFGLPNRPIDDISSARPIVAGHVSAAAHGGCTGVVADQLTRGRPVADTAVAERSLREHRDGQSRSLLVERELPSVIDLLDSAGVEPVLIGGLVAAHDGSLPSYVRDIGHLDLLVRPAHIDAAAAALRCARFARHGRSIGPDYDRRFATQMTWRGRFSGDWANDDAPPFDVRLHRTSVDGPFGALVPLDDLHAQAVPVRIHRRWYRTLHPTHRFVLACQRVVLCNPESGLDDLRDLVSMAPRTLSGAEDVVDVARRWHATAVVQDAVAHVENTLPMTLSQELVGGISECHRPLRERLLLATYHRHGRSSSLTTVASAAVVGRWPDRRDLLLAHLRNQWSHRRHRN